MSFCLILLAAGSSHRFKSNLAKPYHKIGGKTLLEITLKKTGNFRQIKKTIVIYKKQHLGILKKLRLKNIKLIEGGSSRQESTFNALKYLHKQRGISKVLIHDVARPNFSKELLFKIIKHAKKFKAVIPTLTIQDAIKQKYVSSKYEYFVGKDRSDLFLTQTPQCFNFKEIFNLHINNKDKYHDDDLSLLVDLNNVKFLEGEKNNFKITDKIDFESLKKIYKSEIKVGIGFDVHRLVPKRKLYLAGLKIKSKFGTLGHSDGDPILHSITDAILGASSTGDIGQLFSDKSEKNKDIRSTIILKKVISKINDKGYFINNLDINIITQSPKIQKYKKKMIENIAKLCEISKERINIKGKTTEKLGVIGKEKAIACEVITSLIKYD
jgi:2-C-methyl-D-erythritol 4-phosphate cytidylyltransferase / 2-C-methyl-D-erythritol 2,4-cyclodiphosphate synthase